MERCIKKAAQQFLFWKTKVADYLFEKGVSLNAVNHKKYPPLRSAIKRGQKDAVEWLLDHGIDINEKWKNGETPLFLAVKNDHHHVVKLLLQRGANVNEKLANNNTVLHEACQNVFGNLDVDSTNNVPMIKLLLEFGVEIDAKDRDGRTPFRAALEDNGEYVDENLMFVIQEFAKIKLKEEMDPLQRVTHLSDLELIDQKYPKYKAFYSKCLEELRIMYETKLPKSLTIYEALIIKNSYQLVLLLKKEKIAELINAYIMKNAAELSSRQCGSRLYILHYSDKVKEAKKIKKAMDELDDKLYSTLGVILPDLVIRKILGYLYWMELGVQES